MSMGLKRSLSILALFVIFAGCNKKATYPHCKSDVDCLVDATGKEKGGVCLMGKCEECAVDTDCSDFKQCVNNRCESACQADADCGRDKHCADGVCTADCLSDANCHDGGVCAKGRCMAAGTVGHDIYGMEGGAGTCGTLSRVHFDFDRYDIKPQYRDHVEKLAQCLQANPGMSVTIEGHTDDRGTTSHNMALGDYRALEVKRYLEKVKGIASSRINTVSFGEQKPLDGESNEKAWQQNRRTEFVLGSNN